MSPRANVPESKSAEPQFISRDRAAAILDCSVQLVDKAIHEGRLPAYRFGRRVLLRMEDLLRALEQVRTAPAKQVRQ